MQTTIMFCLVALVLLVFSMTLWSKRPPALPPVDVRETIDINIPVRAVFDEWTEFERYPHFIEGVKEVEVIDHWHMRWKTELNSREMEFDTKMDEQIPDKSLAWTSHTTPAHTVALRFARLSANRTRLTVEIQIAGNGDAMDGLHTAEQVRAHVAKTLRKCKQLLEERGRGYSYSSVRRRP